MDIDEGANDGRNSPPSPAPRAFPFKTPVKSRKHPAMTEKGHPGNIMSTTMCNLSGNNSVYFLSLNWYPRRCRQPPLTAIHLYN